MLASSDRSQKLLDQNAELAARLKLLDRVAAERLEQLERERVASRKLKEELGRLTERAALLEEEVRWLKEQFFGRSSQQDAAVTNPDQGLLFNEAEVLAAIAAADAAHAARTKPIAAHERRHTGGRKAIPEHFPRIEIEHDLPEHEKLCTQCSVPHALTRIGEETRECYRYEPPKVSVERHVRPTYVCEERHEAPITAPAPPVILPKSMASPSLLAYLVTAKFVDGLPLYRVARQLERLGMELSPGTAGSWVNTVGGEKIVPLINLLNDALLAAPFIQIDETHLQVLRSDKAVGADHYIVVRAAGPPGRRIILYDYLPSRTTEGLKALLMGADGPYRGKLLTDGLERYDDIAAALKLEHFGCLQHCRAYYYKARKVSQLPGSRSLANVAIEDYIGKVYAVEKQIKALREAHECRGEALPLSTVLAWRQEKTKPVMEQFKAWVEKLQPATPPKSALGQAFSYTLNQWSKLERFLEHPEMPADNNYTEQQIKQFVIGRKAWLFAHDKVGAQASANLYSLTMTARANDIEPFAYLNNLFERLPAATTVEEVEALLPWNVKPGLQQHNTSPASPASAVAVDQS
ncbi:MAG: IS66 family transposase [Woeseiaceae bacterium]